MSEEEKQVTDTNSTSEENQNEEQSEEESTEKSEGESTDESKDESEEKASDIDYAKELNNLESNEVPIKQKPSQRSEEEKAKFSYEKIVERFPHFTKESTTESVADDRMDEMQNLMLRNQVEGIIRGNSKGEDEVKYKMYFYDKRIQQTGNIHDDADNAEWLANKARTRNAIAEAKRHPGKPGSGSGAGQKTPSGQAPELPPEEHQRLIAAGLKKVSPNKYEGAKTIIEWDAKQRQWDQTMK